MTEPEPTQGESSLDELPEPGVSGAGPSPNRVVRGFGVVFFTYVALTMGFVLVPIESVLRSELKPLFSRFLVISGLDQHWNMFGTISYHRDYAVIVEVEPPHGGGWQRVEGLGPILPGLREVPAHFRYHTFFTRLDEKRYAVGVDPYLAAVGRAIVEDHPEWEGRRYRIRKVAGRLNSLDTIRELDQPSFELSTIHGPEVLKASEGGAP